MDGWVYEGLFGFWPLLACSRELGFYSRELGFHGIYSFNHYHVLHMLYLVSGGSGSVRCTQRRRLCCAEI
jgi:hypothetical protein